MLLEIPESATEGEVVVTATAEVTLFASAQRASSYEVAARRALVEGSPIIQALLKAASGLLAILNEERQVLAANMALLEDLGVHDPEQLLGLRPGEVFGCVHAEEPPNGCGTTLFCASCGAAIAMVASLASDDPVEKRCALTVHRNGVAEDLCLSVRSCPILLDGERLLLLFIQDITQFQEAAATEQVFLHDLSNVVSPLLSASELLADSTEEDRADLHALMLRLSQRLAREIDIRRTLVHASSETLNVRKTDVFLREAIGDVWDTFAHHPAASGKHLVIPVDVPPDTVCTDPALLHHVLVNMVKNACEAAGPGEEIRLWVESEKGAVRFCVWNRAPIPESIAARVFQRHFTTKSGTGRGLGAYSMKLLGERVLGGAVRFTTSEKDGTVFVFTVPR